MSRWSQGSAIDIASQSWGGGLIGSPWRPLVALVPDAPVAGDVELDAVADDIAGDAVAQGPDQALNRGGAELTDVPAPDADRVVMVSDASEAVPGDAVEEVKPAYNADFHEELDGPEDGGPAHPRQLNANLLGRKALLLSLQDPYDLPSRSRCPVASVLKGGHDVWV